MAKPDLSKMKKFRVPGLMLYAEETAKGLVLRHIKVWANKNEIAMPKDGNVSVSVKDDTLKISFDGKEEGAGG